MQPKKKTTTKKKRDRKVNSTHLRKSFPRSVLQGDVEAVGQADFRDPGPHQPGADHCDVRQLHFRFGVRILLAFGLAKEDRTQSGRLGCDAQLSEGGRFGRIPWGGGGGGGGGGVRARERVCTCV